MFVRSSFGPMPFFAVTAAAAFAATTAVVGSAVFLPVTAFAQTGDTVIVTSPTYKIVPEDVLEISVVDHPDVNKTVPVSTDGTIDFPYVGQITVSGLTVSELKKRLARDLSKQFVRPQVLITVSQRRVRTFNAIGTGVKTPGKHPVREGERLLEAFSEIGGLPADRAEFYTARLFRNGAEIPVDLVKLLQNDPAANILIQPDDTLMVVEKEAAQTTVQVLGQVGRPGPMAWPRDGSIITVLQGAGGPTPLARLSQVTIERDGKDIIVDMRNYQKNGFEPSQRLLPGDKLIVPENKLEYYVFGPVARAGTQLYPDDRKLTVYSVLAQSGTLQGTEYKKTKLVHPITKPDGEKSTITTLVDVDHMVKTGDLSADLPVEPGDTIIVPPSGGRRGIGILEAVGIFTGVFGVLSYFRR